MTYADYINGMQEEMIIIPILERMSLLEYLVEMFGDEEIKREINIFGGGDKDGHEKNDSV